MAPYLNVWCALLPSTIMQKLKTFDDQFRRKSPNTPNFSPFNPQIKIFFQNFSKFFTLFTPNLTQILEKN